MQVRTLKRGKRRVAVVTILLSFFVVMTVVSPRPARALSLSQENEMGHKILEQIKAQMPLVQNPYLMAYVRSIGNRLVQHIGITPYHFHFFVIDEPVANAFAVPGAYIFVYRGLIEMMRTEGELAAVMSHEMGHIVARHFQKKIEQGKILGIASLAGVLAAAVVGATSGGAASGALASGAMAGAQTMQLKFSRQDERQADELGFHFLCAAGYPPQDMYRAMQLLNRATYDVDSTIPSYLLTHPGLTERIGYLEEMAEKQLRKHPFRKPVKTEGDFALMRAVLISQYDDPQTALARLRDGIHAGSEANSYGLGRLYLREGRVDRALPYLLEAARHFPTDPMVLETLGSAYYQKGRLQQAQRVLESALLVDPNDVEVHYRLAVVLQGLDRQEEALQQLEQIADAAATLPDINYRLGVLLGQMNHLGEAHFYLGRYYQHEGAWETALFHYERAKALLKGAPEKQKEIDAALKKLNRKVKQSIWKRAGSSVD